MRPSLTTGVRLVRDQVGHLFLKEGSENDDRG